MTFIAWRIYLSSRAYSALSGEIAAARKRPRRTRRTHPRHFRVVPSLKIEGKELQHYRIKPLKAIARILRKRQTGSEPTPLAPRGRLAAFCGTGFKREGKELRIV